MARRHVVALTLAVIVCGILPVAVSAAGGTQIDGRVTMPSGGVAAGALVGFVERGPDDRVFTTSTRVDQAGRYGAALSAWSGAIVEITVETIPGPQTVDATGCATSFSAGIVTDLTLGTPPAPDYTLDLGLVAGRFQSVVCPKAAVTPPATTRAVTDQRTGSGAPLLPWLIFAFAALIGLRWMRPHSE